MSLTFQDQQGTALQVKLKPQTSMKKAMDAFSARTQRERRMLRFIFEGQRVLDTHTPEEVSNSTLGDPSGAFPVIRRENRANHVL
jgi:small ubiquitin-related modifier